MEYAKQEFVSQSKFIALSLSCIGEGNGNPLRCSCLENPRDGGAWWAAVYGVAQSQTRLKQLSSRGKYLVARGPTGKLGEILGHFLVLYYHYLKYQFY